MPKRSVAGHCERQQKSLAQYVCAARNETRNTKHRSAFCVLRCASGWRRPQNHLEALGARCLAFDCVCSRPVQTPVALRCPLRCGVLGRARCPQVVSPSRGSVLLCAYSYVVCCALTQLVGTTAGPSVVLLACFNLVFIWALCVPACNRQTQKAGQHGAAHWLLCERLRRAQTWAAPGSLSLTSTASAWQAEPGLEGTPKEKKQKKPKKKEEKKRRKKEEKRHC